MTITYTGNLKLAQPTTGTEAGTWGDVVNQQITALLDQSVAGTASLTSMTNADYTLTSGNGSAPNEARYMALSVPSTLTLTAARNIIVPTSSKAYIIRNLTTGGFAVTLKTSAGTGISVPNGKTMILYCDGTNVIDGTDYFTSITVGALTATGNVTATKLIPTGGTATGNGMYLPATNAIAWSNNGAETMRLDASGNLGIGTISPGAKLHVDGGSLAPTSGPVARFDTTATTAYSSGGFAGGQLRLNYGNATNSYGGISFSNFGATSQEFFGVVQNSSGYGAFVWQGFNGSGYSERMRLDAPGNLGLGVTPSGWGASGSSYKALQLGISASVYGRTANETIGIVSGAYFDNVGPKYSLTGNSATIYNQASGSHTWSTAPSGTAGNAITFTQAMTLDASGNLLVGTTSNGSNSRLVSALALGGFWNTNIRNTAASGGYYGILLSNDGYAPNDATSTFLQCSDTVTPRATIRSNGGIANYQANNVNLSDRREKTNFAPAKSYLDTICAIPVQTFNYIDQNLEQDPGLTLGVVAQDVQAVAPELVMESNWGTKEDPKMRLSLYQTDLQYALMKCIQEQQALITSLTARISALESPP